MKTTMKYQWITITIEARAALDGLPQHVKRGRLLQDFKLIVAKPHHTVGFRLSKTRSPHNAVETQSILIINLCNAYNEFIHHIHELEIHNL